MRKEEERASGSFVPTCEVGACRALSSCLSARAVSMLILALRRRRQRARATRVRRGRAPRETRRRTPRWLAKTNVGRRRRASPKTGIDFAHEQRRNVRELHGAWGVHELGEGGKERKEKSSLVRKKQPSSIHSFHRLPRSSPSSSSRRPRTRSRTPSRRVRAPPPSLCSPPRIRYREPSIV